MENHNEIWDWIKDLTGKDFHTDIVVYDNQKITTKTTIYQTEIKTSFYDEGVPLEKFPCVTYSIKLIDSIYESEKRNCSSQKNCCTILKE